MKKRRMNNQGFSLVEVLISIVILAILLVPALNSFASIAKVNKKSSIEQKASTLAQNILESLETMSMEETSNQFSGAEILKIVNSNLNGFSDSYYVDSYLNGGYGEYMLQGAEYLPADATYLATDRSTYYYTIKGLKDHGTSFDAVITLDTSIYDHPLKYPDTMNNYKMPRLLELNDSTLAIIDLENTADDMQINEFERVRAAYLAALANATPTIKPGDPTPIPTPAPPEITRTQIIAATKKDINIEIIKDSLNKVVTFVCKVKYTCSIDLNADGIAEVSPISEVFRGTYAIPTAASEDGNGFLFYTPSIFSGRDTINITNNGAKVNFYLANQETPASNIIVNYSNHNGGQTKVLSNYIGTVVNSVPVANANLYEVTDDEDRIYNISIAIYPEGTIATRSLKNPYVTFTTAKEN